MTYFHICLQNGSKAVTFKASITVGKTNIIKQQLPNDWNGYVVDAFLMWEIIEQL